MNIDFIAAFADGKIDTALKAKKAKRPPKLAYKVARKLVHMYYKNALNVSFKRTVNMRKIKTPFILLCNHVSRPDWYFASYAIQPKVANFISAHNEWFGKDLSGIFNFFNNIPKKVYQTDTQTLRAILKIVGGGGSLIMYPTAVMALDSLPKPIAPGTAKLLKKLGIPVLSCVFNGAYMSGPKHTTNVFKGKIEVEVDELFTPGQLAEFSEEEILTKIHQSIDQCDFDWIKTNDVVFDTKGVLAENLEVLLYKCPKCHKEFTNISKGNTLTCSNCNNSVTIDGRYSFTANNKDSIALSDVRDWINYEKSELIKEIQSADFSLSCDVDFHLLPRDEPVKHNTVKVGSGKIRLNHDGIYFEGDCYNEKFELFVERRYLHSMISLKELNSFGFYYNSIWYDFHPKQAGIATKAIFACEEIYKLHGGEWVN